MHHTLHRSLLVAALVCSSSAAAAATDTFAPPPPEYAVTLTTDRTALETGEHATLTTTASQDLSGTRWTTYLFDQTDPSWYRRCKVQACSFSVTHTTPGTHTYIAYIARDREEPRYPPMQIQATSDPVSVTWSAPTYAVTLAADRTWVRPGATVTLQAVANKDMAGRPFAIQVFDLTTGARVAICETGSSCSASVRQVTPSTRAYQAYIAEPGTSPPPPNVQATSEAVSVTWSVLPDPTRPPNVGGGSVVGTAQFEAPGVPPLGQACTATRFTFTGESASAWVNGSATTYVGPVAVLASGASPCDTASFGSGVITVSASGTNDLGQELSCGPLDGTFTRVATDATIVVGGDCVINGFDAFRISFVAKGEIHPTNDGGGVTTHVTEARFAGAFAVLPN